MALWKETDPNCRVVMARQLADWAATFAEMEAEAVNRLCEKTTPIETPSYSDFQSPKPQFFVMCRAPRGT
jgi:hypothetical protein